MKNWAIASAVVVLMLLAASMDGSAADWSRFRGPNGSGIAEVGALPTTFSDIENLRWKIPLPGAGSSSPIVVGDQLYVTCYSGYGIDREDPGDIEDLQRHLVCVDRATGDVRWQKAIKAFQPEDPYKGFITEHGYASSTPVSDGVHVFAFLGKSGVVAYDAEGNQLWQTSVGTESGPRHWGSASSPILYKDLVIVNACEESGSFVALAKSDGQEVWRAEAEGMTNAWGTPILVDTDAGTELAIAVPGEVWGLNPDNGKTRWSAKSFDDNAMCSSLVAGDGIVYAVGGRGGTAVAIRTGGSGDVTDSNVLWSGQLPGSIATPLLYDGYLYSVARGVANCASAQNGEHVYQERLRSEGGGRRGPGGGDYASPVVADRKIYVTTRSGTVYVLAAKPEFQLLATNTFEDDGSDFNGTPAVANDALFFRSDKYLYCVANE